MIHVDRILFPTDGSDCAERARRHAVHLADQFEATLHVIHVEKRDVARSEGTEIREADLLDRLHRSAPGTSSRPPAPRVRERSVASRSVAEGILTYAVEHDVHLVVLGTHGRRGVHRLLLGSVAKEVVRQAPGLVVTVGRGAVEPAAMDGGRMLVPVDFSDHQRRLLTHAREIALVYGMTVTIFHAVEPGDRPDVYDVDSTSPDTDLLTERARAALEDRVELLRKSGVDASIEVRVGPPAQQVLEAANDLDAAFLTIATHGRTGLERMLMGSVAGTVLRQAPCPVCTVKSLGPSLVMGSDGSG